MLFFFIDLIGKVLGVRMDTDFVNEENAVSRSPESVLNEETRQVLLTNYDAFITLL